jgi:hypothetical protein
MQALKLEPKNKTAKSEMQLLQKIMELDSQISLDQLENYKSLKPVLSNNKRKMFQDLRSNEKKEKMDDSMK